MEVVGQARNGAEAIELAQLLRPDVVWFEEALPPDDIAPRSSAAFGKLAPLLTRSSPTSSSCGATINTKTFART